MHLQCFPPMRYINVTPNTNFAQTWSRGACLHLCGSIQCSVAVLCGFSGQFFSCFVSALVKKNNKSPVEYAGFEEER